MYIPMWRIKRIHRGHFFDKATMRFFDSRLSQGGYLTPDETKAYFVTSEQFHSSGGKAWPREYTVRVIDMVTGDIETWPDYNGFGAYATSAAATRAAKRAASGKVKGA